MFEAITTMPQPSSYAPKHLIKQREKDFSQHTFKSHVKFVIEKLNSRLSEMTGPLDDSSI